MQEHCPRCGADVVKWSDHRAGCAWHGAGPVTLRIMKAHEARCHGSRASAAERAVMARDVASLETRYDKKGCGA